MYVASPCTAMPVVRNGGAVASHESGGVAVERRVVTHRRTHLSRLVREAASRLMRPRKGHALKHFLHRAYKRLTSKRTTQQHTQRRASCTSCTSCTSCASCASCAGCAGCPSCASCAGCVGFDTFDNCASCARCARCASCARFASCAICAIWALPILGVGR